MNEIVKNWFLRARTWDTENSTHQKPTQENSTQENSTQKTQQKNSTHFNTFN